MEAKEFLRQYRKYEIMLENKTTELIQCKESITNITAKWGGDKVQGSRNPHRMEDTIAKYIDYEKEINRNIDEMLAVKKDIIDVIEKLDTNQYNVLHKMYIQRLSFKEIAFDCRKSESWATTIHGQALKAVQKILDERELTEA